MAYDRTTPLARAADGTLLPQLEMAGLLTSNFPSKVDIGIYMLRPYDPGKIPVVLVHGLNSSPRAWVQTINDLRNDPVLSKKYQFWVFLYPTGRAIPNSAASLRRALHDVRESLDPQHADPAFDHAVLVGHSMGGILSKMMVQHSGTTLWDSAFRVPFDQLKAPDALKGWLSESLFYHPVPYVKRVVFIATPHRGSLIANRFVGRLTSRLMTGPDEQAKVVRELEEHNGPGVVDPVLKGNLLGSVDELRTDSPVLAALNLLTIESSIPYHSIIPQIRGKAGGSDGIVTYRSSHLEGAASEKIIPGFHSAQQSAPASEELRRILLLHLAESNL